MTKAASVWVVEQGEYSDYRVVGVFSSKENARIVADAINKGNPYSEAIVAVWPLDPAVGELRAGYQQHVVHMLRDGTVERCTPWDTSGYELAGSCEIWHRSKAPAYRDTGTPDCLTATVWARDVDHAIKITNEKRAQMIASGRWK